MKIINPTISDMFIKIKSQIAFFIVALFCFTKITAQNYEPLLSTNKVWTVGEASSIYGSLNYGNSYNYKVGNDTIILDKTYKIILRTHDSLITPFTIYAYLREEVDNKKVFAYYNSDLTNEFLLYDFSLNKGDTLKRGIDFDEYCTLVVDSVDYVLIGEDYRKRYFLNEITYNNDIWIEGIGSLRSLRYPEMCWVGMISELLCYHENSELKYINPTYNTCFLEYVGINNKTNETPNITVKNNIIEININEEKAICEFKFFDLHGKILYSEKIQHSTNINIEQLNIPSGVYYYSFSNNLNNTKSAEKFVYLKN